MTARWVRGESGVNWEARSESREVWLPGTSEPDTAWQEVTVHEGKSEVEVEGKGEEEDEEEREVLIPGTWEPGTAGQGTAVRWKEVGWMNITPEYTERFCKVAGGFGVKVPECGGCIRLDHTSWLSTSTTKRVAFIKS